MRTSRTEEELKYFVSRIGFLCFTLSVVIGASCDNPGSSAELAEVGVTRQPYVLGSHFNPEDDLILTEFDAFGGPNIVNYPLCIYPEADGQAIEDPDGVQDHMETIVNTWLPYLYNRWGFGVYSVRFELKATTESDCAERYDGVRPFCVTSYEGGAFGGMAVRIRVRFPGKTINAFSDGQSHRQSILHEVGHVFGLMHTMDQTPISVMDYDDMHNFKGIGGDDIVGLTHAWKYLSGQVERGECEFGYEGGPTCAPTAVTLQKKQIRNGLAGVCLQAAGTYQNAKLVSLSCSGDDLQSFDVLQVENGWHLQLSNSELCVKAADTSDGGLLTLANCSRTDSGFDFTLSLNSDNSYMLRNELSGMVLQFDGGAVTQSPPDGGKDQTWMIDEWGTTCDEVDCCPDDETKKDPGVCGCGVPDVDSDGDGTMDCDDGCPDNPNKTEPDSDGCAEGDSDTEVYLDTESEADTQSEIDTGTDSDTKTNSDTAKAAAEGSGASCCATFGKAGSSGSLLSLWLRLL